MDLTKEAGPDHPIYKGGSLISAGQKRQKPPAPKTEETEDVDSEEEQPQDSDNKREK